MAHLEIKPAVDFNPYGQLPFEETLSTKRPEKDSSGFDVLSSSKNTMENLEKAPIGIETSMVYIALPVGIIVWISIFYFIKVIFF
jgi:hypothetical protein